jgi:hypothetical protein
MKKEALTLKWKKSMISIINNKKALKGRKEG